MELDNSDGLVNLKNLADWVVKGPLRSDPKVPIVMVPGFTGWGAPLLGAINYWGGYENVPQLLVKKGYTVIVSPIGPISSNWERACELYRQLTFGKFDIFNSSNTAVGENDVDIDYGDYFKGSGKGPVVTKTVCRKRAILFADEQKQKDFEGWVWSGTNKVHFICHSQGGNTVRYLLGLMSQGAGSLHSTYFSEPNRDNWAISVTTLGTPHRGTTIIDVLKNFVGNSTDQTAAATKLLAKSFATVSFSPLPNRAFDLQLDHWGICSEKKESFQEMYQRLEKSPGPVQKWLLSNHNGFYDNSIEGVNDLNLKLKKYTNSEHIYYFSLSFHATIPFPSDWPPWTTDALETFPIPLVDFIHRVLSGIPGVRIGTFIIDAIIHQIIHRVGWRILSKFVELRSAVRWATDAVANRLLQVMGYDVVLPPPGKYLPRKDVIPIMLPTAYAMGGQDLTERQKDILGRDNLGDWFLNDGIVNTESMRGPQKSIVKEIREFPAAKIDSNDARGIYWHFGVNDQMDHADEIGVWTETDTGQSTQAMFVNLADLVSRLRAKRTFPSL